MTPKKINDWSTKDWTIEIFIKKIGLGGKPLRKNNIITQILIKKTAWFEEAVFSIVPLPKTINNNTKKTL